MIDWKEIYSQVAPLFDTYYQWQVVFVVGEGLFLIFFNWLIYKYLKKKKYAWVMFLLLASENIFFVYQSYQKLDAKIQVVQFQTPEIRINCEEFEKLIPEEGKDICNLPDVSWKERIVTFRDEMIGTKNFETEKIEKLYTIKSEELSEDQNIEADININNSFFWSKFDSFYRKKDNYDMNNYLKMDSLYKVYTDIENIGFIRASLKMECKEYEKQDNYFYAHTYSICIKKGNQYYTLMLITKQNEIIYKITDKELKEYIF